MKNFLHRTKIICTAGPSVNSLEKLRSLVDQGMSVLRLNCSHGDENTRNQTLKLIRKVEKKINRPVGIMVDLQGPKLRVSELQKPLELHRSEEWKMTFQEKDLCENKTIPVSFKNLSHAVEVGTDIFLDDGLIQTKVTKIDKNEVWVKIIHGGLLESRKGINIPYFRGKQPILSKKDKEDLTWALNNQVDYIALSFVRSANDIKVLKKFIENHKPKVIPKLIAKIEKPEAVENIQEIVKISDAILLARGDLGIELHPQKVPVVQKKVIEICRQYKRPVIVATQMLNSMRMNPRPTRAEVSDVASTIYEGTDAVLLTGETSAGKFPIEATKMMSEIIQEVEAHIATRETRHNPKYFGIKTYHEFFVMNAVQLASDIDAKAIIVLTKRGQMSRLLSKIHPKQPIFSISDNQTSYRQLSILWGVFPLEINQDFIDKRIQNGMNILKKKNLVKKNDKVLFIYRDYQSENLNLKVVESN